MSDTHQPIPGTMRFGQQGTDRSAETAAMRAERIMDKRMAEAMPAGADFFKDAPCVGHYDIFLPDDDGNHAVEAVEEAQAICAGCPVIGECEEWLLGEGSLLYTQGVWFGVDVTEVFRAQRREEARVRRGKEH